MNKDDLLDALRNLMIATITEDHHTIEAISQLFYDEVENVAKNEQGDIVITLMSEKRLTLILNEVL